MKQRDLLRPPRLQGVHIKLTRYCTNEEELKLHRNTQNRAKIANYQLHTNASYILL